MNEELTIRVRVPVPCTDCDGRGVYVGKLDPDAGKREALSCPRCDGFGLRFVSVTQEEALFLKEPR